MMPAICPVTTPMRSPLCVTDEDASGLRAESVFSSVCTSSDFTESRTSDQEMGCDTAFPIRSDWLPPRLQPLFISPIPPFHADQKPHILLGSDGQLHWPIGPQPPCIDFLLVERPRWFATRDSPTTGFFGPQVSQRMSLPTFLNDASHLPGQTMILVPRFPSFIDGGPRFTTLKNQRSLRPRAKAAM